MSRLNSITKSITHTELAIGQNRQAITMVSAGDLYHFKLGDIRNRVLAYT
jgi:hypothetical protein